MDGVSSEPNKVGQRKWTEEDSRNRRRDDDDKNRQRVVERSTSDAPSNEIQVHRG